jgi:3-hydroxymyristoyl/3-hydroxydecanoyl-(acyl carrier protein) dehydratase
MFEWLESLVIDEAGATAAAEARIAGDVPFLSDHFPGHPLLPGSLQIELCAQVAGPLVDELVARRDAAERFAFLGMVRHATFHAPVALPAMPRIFARATRVERASAIVQAELTHAIDAIGCRVELVMILRPAEPGWEDAIRGYRARIAALKRRGPR